MSIYSNIVCVYFIYEKKHLFLLTFFCQENVMPALVSGLDVPPLMDLILFYILVPMNIATINTWMWVFIFEIILKKLCSRMDGLHGSCIFSFLRNLHDNFLVVTFNLHNSLCIEPSSEPSWAVFTFCVSLIIILTMVRWYVTMLLSCNSVLICNSEYFCL